MKLTDYIQQQLSYGYYSFTTEQAVNALHKPKTAVLAALGRLAHKGAIVSPVKGFYLIVPPEFRTLGCLPPDQSTLLIMQHLQLNYYVGLLSAAQYYGAAHQQPQLFQVMLEKNRSPIECGKTNIVFISKKLLKDTPTKLFKTPRGPLTVATPEAIAFDMVNHLHQSGGLNNVATVLVELAELIELEKLIELAEASKETLWIQRLGYLFQLTENDQLANLLESCLQKRMFYFKALDPKKPIKGFPRDKTWKLIINSEVEPDL